MAKDTVIAVFIVRFIVFLISYTLSILLFLCTVFLLAIRLPILNKLELTVESSYAERCISYDKILSDRPSDRLSHAGIMPKRLQLRSCGLHWGIAP